MTQASKIMARKSLRGKQAGFRISTSLSRVPAAIARLAAQYLIAQQHPTCGSGAYLLLGRKTADGDAGA